MAARSVASTSWLLLGVLCLAGSADAQIYYPRPVESAASAPFAIRVPDLAVGSDFSGDWVASQAPYRSGRVTEWVRFQVRGHLISPRHFRLDLVGRPRIGQGWDQRSDAGLSHDGLTGRATLSIMEVSGIRGSLEAERRDSYEDLPFGGFQRVDESTLRATVRDVNPLLPVEATYQKVSGSRVFGGGTGSALEVDRDVERFRFQGQNSKTRILADRTEHRSMARTVERRSLRDRALLQNRQRWGKGSSALGRMEYRRRQLDNEFRRLTASQHVYLQHAPSLSSEYRYFYSRESGEGWRGGGTEGEVKLNAQVGRVVRTSVGLVRLNRRIDTGRYREHQVHPRLRFQARLFEGLRVQGGASGVLGWRRDLEAAPRFGTVLEELHLVDPSGRFKLTEAFVDPGSVHLESAADGTRYEEDLDYRLVEEGPFLLVVVLPGGRVEEGSEVVATYRYRIDPTPRSRYVNARAHLTLEWGGLRLFGSRVYRDGGSGGQGHGAPSLSNLQQTLVGLNWAYASVRLRTSLGAQWDHSLAEDVELDTRSVRGRVAYLLAPGLTAEFQAARTEGRWGRTRFTTSELEHRLSWALRRTLSIGGGVSYLDWDQVQMRERHLGIRADLVWETGNQRVELRFDRSRWRREAPLLRDRLLLRVSRDLR